MQTDAELLTEYAATQSEAAFAQLVQRHIGLVYSAALRQVPDPHLAQEIAQAVFIILARKAGSLANGGLRRHVALAGWLCRTAHLAARDALKMERRRQLRDHNAYLEAVMNPTEAETQAAWQHIAPLLDEAVAGLGETDRAALVLRYFENRPWQEVAALLQVTEDAAQKRVMRALEKLRKLFAKRGVALTGTLIASAVMGNSVQAAPVELAVKTGTIAAKGLATTKTTAALVKGTLKAMAWTRGKIISSITGGIIGLFAVGVITTAGKHASEKWSVTEQAVQVDGKIDVVQIDEDGKEMPPRSYSFTVCLATNVWEITMTNNPLDFSRFIYDGTQLYGFVDFETLVANKKPEINQGSGWVTYNQVPNDFASSDGVGQIWIAYASGAYFQNLKTNRVVFPWIWRPTNDLIYLSQGHRPQSVDRAETLPARWSLQNSLPHLPESITYMGKLDGEEITNLQFTATSFTNVGGFFLPLETSFQINNFDHKKNGMQPFMSYRIHTLSAKILDRMFVFPPMVPVITGVADYRFEGRRDPNPSFPASYFATNRFLTRTEVTRTAEFKKYKLGKQ